MHVNNIEMRNLTKTKKKYKKKWKKIIIHRNVGSRGGYAKQMRFRCLTTIGYQAQDHVHCCIQTKAIYLIL